MVKLKKFSIFFFELSLITTAQTFNHSFNKLALFDSEEKVDKTSKNL